MRCVVLTIALWAFVSSIDAQDTLSVSLPRSQRHREQVVRQLPDTLSILENDTVTAATVIVP